MNFYQAVAIPSALLALILAIPVFAQEAPATCRDHVAAMESAVDAQGDRRALFDEHLAMIRETERRGEERLCRDLSNDLRQRLNEADV